MAKRRCSIDGCENLHDARGWCNKHYKRWQNHGDPLRSAYTPEHERFWSKVAKSEGCWLWTAGTTVQGYGKFRVGSMKEVHDASFRPIVIPTSLSTVRSPRGCISTTCAGLHCA